jgi:hypothetical protein
VLVAIAQNCTKMRHLFLNECEQITEVGLRALATLPVLRFVSISASVGQRGAAALTAFRADVRVYQERNIS